MSAAQKAFEEWYQRQVVYAGNRYPGIEFVWHAAIAYQREFDAKICEDRKFTSDLVPTEESYNAGCSDCAEAIQKVSL